MATQLMDLTIQEMNRNSPPSHLLIQDLDFPLNTDTVNRMAKIWDATFTTFSRMHQSSSPIWYQVVQQINGGRTATGLRYDLPIIQNMNPELPEPSPDTILRARKALELFRRTEKYPKGFSVTESMASITDHRFEEGSDALALLNKGFTPTDFIAALVDHENKLYNAVLVFAFKKLKEQYPQNCSWPASLDSQSIQTFLANPKHRTHLASLFQKGLLTRRRTVSNENERRLFQAAIAGDLDYFFTDWAVQLGTRNLCKIWHHYRQKEEETYPGLKAITLFSVGALAIAALYKLQRRK